jgi:para-aminobenzoate synthetase component 2
MLSDMRVLVVDNYDSFVYNLVQYLAQLGADPEVLRNDDEALVTPASLEATLAKYDAVLVSPGPGSPDRAGASIDIIKLCAAQAKPVFGVCLGQQAMGEAWGATVERAPELLHGKTSQVEHKGQGVLANLPNPFTATRYHSLAVREDTIPSDWEVTARTDTGVVMAMRHRTLPVEGVQFHPESVLTEGGHRMLANWLRATGFPVPENLVVELETDMRKLVAGVS